MKFSNLKNIKMNINLIGSLQWRILFRYLLMLSIIMVYSVGSVAQVEEAAGGAGMEAGVTAAINAGLGLSYSKQCTPSQPSYCGLAALSFLQATKDLAAKKNAGKTKAAIQAGNSGFDTGFGGDVGSGGLSPQEDKLLLETAKNLEHLKVKGFSVDPKTGAVTTPKGKFPNSTFASAKTMADAGLIPADQIESVDATIKAVLKDSARVVSMGIAGGGGGSSSSSSARTAAYSYDDPYKSLYGDREKPNDPRTTGLTRSLASGESIGSQTDNLFEMIKRKYQKKSEEKIFVGQEFSQ